MPSSRSLLGIWFLMPALAGCPASVDSKASDAASGKRLTPADKPSDLESGASAQGPRPGVGSPDETNGECRLFAERYEEPTCCPRSYGLGVEDVAEICGYEVFLGEYLKEGCRYSFYDAEHGDTMWIKLALLADGRPLAEVVEDADKWLRKRKRDESFKSTMLDGEPGVAYNLVNPVGWATFAGWRRHRQATWKKGFCGDKLEVLLRKMADAPEPEEDSGGFRRGLVPSSTAAVSPKEGAPTGAPAPHGAAPPNAGDKGPPAKPAG